MALYYTPDLSSALVQRGRASLALGNYPAVIIDCTAALRANPRNLSAYRFRAEAHAAAGDQDRAAADYTAWLRLTGELPNANRAAAEARLASLCGQSAPSVN
jgi:tetratricopeptide (TPR) repeat protein